jgi:hypothetical protein
MSFSICWNDRSFRDLCLTNSGIVVLAFHTTSPAAVCLEAFGDIAKGEFPWQKRAGERTCCGGVTTCADYVYATDHISDRIQVFHVADRSFVRSLGDGLLVNPSAIAISQAGIFVVCNTDCRALSHTGDLLFRFGFGDDGSLLRPTISCTWEEIIVSRGSHIYGFDANNGCPLRTADLGEVLNHVSLCHGTVACTSGWLGCQPTFLRLNPDLSVRSQGAPTPLFVWSACNGRCAYLTADIWASLQVAPERSVPCFALPQAVPQAGASPLDSSLRESTSWRCGKHLALLAMCFTMCFVFARIKSH